ncbi:MAG: radical SAM protein [Myxococcota bacterium]|jgi:MoaA/NifB/PqqE/SkfB family radical SAM enzyme|nr:radical SAM protein [Myxococcota bacterium]
MSDTHGHSEKHLREAQEVTVFGGGEQQHQIELQLGHVCNNRCVFCVSGQLTEQRVAKQIPADPVLAAIRKGREDGCRRVTFLGGEPTTQRSFMPALRLTVELGYEEIVIFTNGIRTRKPEFIQKIIDLGGNYEWRFSVQGGTREAHDAVTLRPGSFDRIVAGMRTCADLGEDVTINMCINRYSYESVPHYPELCKEYGVRQLHIDQVRPSDAGTRTMDYFRDIMVQYSEMAPYFAQMLEGFEAMDPDFDVNLGNYPYCQLPEWAHKIHHDGQKTFTYPANTDGLLPAFDKYPVKRADKFHPPQCGQCAFVKDCNGVFETYAEMYGTDEFVPVTREHLLSIDRDLHFFVQLVEPHLESLLSAQPPAPWQAKERFSNTRDRLLELRYVDDDGRAATLIFTPPEGVGKPVPVHPPILETDRYRMSLLTDKDSDVRLITRLVRWADELLVRADTAVTRPVDFKRLAAGFFAPARLQKGRSRIQRLAASVAQQKTFGDWTWVGTEPLEEGLGAVLRVAHPDGGSVDLVLELQPEADRPLVGVSYRLDEAVAPEEARPVVTELMQALRR